MTSNRALVVAVCLVLSLLLGYAVGRSGLNADADRQSGVDGRAERVVMEVAPERARRDIEPQSTNLDQLDQQGNAFKIAAARVRSAVVFVQVEVHATSPDKSIIDSFGDRLFREHMNPRSVGSGVVISPDGYIVTNYHVVEGARRVQVTLTDKRVFDAELVGTDPSTDLAVLRIDESSLPNAVLGNSDLVEIGEWVLAIGNPFRLRSTVTAGIVSAIGRDVDIIADGSGIEDFIQTDAAINPGNSGGALVNLRGELIGINTAIATESGSNEGYGFAVPSNLVSRVASDLIEYGEVQRGYLGVTVLGVTADRASSVGLDHAVGVELQDVAFGLAAHRAGLRAGDIVISINEQEIDEPNQLQSIVARQEPGDSLRIRYWRTDAFAELDVVILGLTDPATSRWLARQTDASTRRAPRESVLPPHEVVSELGFVASPIGESLRRSFDVPSGVYLLSVLPDGSAASVGMHEDAVIVTVNGERLESITQLRDVLTATDVYAPDARILLETVRRDGSHFFYEVPVAVD